MPHAIVVHNMRAYGEQIQMFPAPSYGSSARPRYDDGLSSDSSLSSSEGNERELQLPHLYVLMQVSGAMMAHRVMMPRGAVTLGGVEQLLLAQHPELRRHRRIILLSLGGQRLPLTTIVAPADHQGFIAIPDPGFGSNDSAGITGSDQYRHALMIAKRAVPDAQRPCTTAATSSRRTRIGPAPCEA